MSSAVFAADTKTNLQSCFEQALLHHESLPLKEQDIIQARARYQQTLGAVFPKVSVSAYESFQEKVVNPNVSGDFLRSHSQQVSIGVTQPLFHGLMEFYGLKANLADKRQQIFLKEDAKRALYEDVAEAYYQVALIERMIATDARVLSVMRGEHKELDAWFKIGKIRASELVSQKTEIAILEAEIEKLKGERLVAYEMLAFLTGLNPQPQIMVTNPLSEKIQSLDYYESQVTNRSDLLAAKELVVMKKNTVKAKKGAFWPALDFEGNYYPYREGIEKDISWDATFSFDLPIFNLSNLGKVKEAKSQLVQSKLTLSEQERQALSDVKQTYALLKSNLSSFSAYHKAANLAEQNVQLKRVDTRLGLATQIDFLQAQKTWVEALRERDAAEVDVWLNSALLKAQAGIYP